MFIPGNEIPFSFYLTGRLKHITAVPLTKKKYPLLLSDELNSFYEIMDNPENYPVLIHCYHGAGRAPLFGAVYRIEYEDMSNEEARDKTRFLLKGSSFDDDSPKGEFLKNYKKRETNK